MLASFLINVVLTFSCLKLYSQLPIAMAAMLLLIDVSVFGNTVVFYKFALIIFNDFENFYQFWKFELKGKQCRMILRSCIPIRVKIGCLFHLESSIILASIMQIVGTTVTLLLA